VGLTQVPEREGALEDTTFVRTLEGRIGTLLLRPSQQKVLVNKKIFTKPRRQTKDGPDNEEKGGANKY